VQFIAGRDDATVSSTDTPC